MFKNTKNSGTLTGLQFVHHTVEHEEPKMLFRNPMVNRYQIPGRFIYILKHTAK